MGVKDLWNILAPIAQKSTLYELQGKTIAVDLGCWVCEGQAVGERVVTQPRMYLRNLFFRTQLLISCNVNLIFVLDGVAPELKLDAMQQRNRLRLKNKSDDADGKMKDNDGSHRAKTGRARFRGILKTCQRMLELIGVSCIESSGEAEALCGQLSREGVVDGVITQDSDVFLYGARVVYRNLSVKSGTGTIEVYKMDSIENKLHLTREKLVAMSLLCGCDYDLAGVHGVGKDTAYKYLVSFSGDILQRLKNLRSDKSLIRYEEERNNCSKCCHEGKPSEHKKSGCLFCGLDKGCLNNVSPLCFKNLDDEKKKEVSLELMIRRKAILEPDFPNQETISEFLHFHQNCTDLAITWLQPNITKFCLYSQRMLEWDLDYAFEKILPLFTRWLLIHAAAIDNMELVPQKLTKKRVVKGVPSFDVAWKVNDENLSGFLSLLSDDCCVILEGNCCTTEPMLLVETRMPDLYGEFIDRTKKQPKEKKPRKKAVKEAKSVNIVGGSSDLHDVGKTAQATSLDIDISSALLKDLNLGDGNYPTTSLNYSEHLFSRTPCNASSPRVSSPLHEIFDIDNSVDHDRISSSPLPFEKGFAFSDNNISAIAPVNDCILTSKAVDLPNDLNDVDLPVSYGLQQSSLSNSTNFRNDSFLTDDDTVDYDISEILDGIISNRQFY